MEKMMSEIMDLKSNKIKNVFFFFQAQGSHQSVSRCSFELNNRSHHLAARTAPSIGNNLNGDFVACENAVHARSKHVCDAHHTR